MVTNYPSQPAHSQGESLNTHDIDTTSQLFIDDHLVDNRWGVEYLTETVIRRFHAPIKHPRNPLIPGQGGLLNVIRDEEDGLFRMWYQEYWDQSMEPRLYTYAIAYAESSDGLDWTLPRIGEHEFKGTKDNNVVLLGPTGGRAESPYLLHVPERFKRGYKYVMLYLTDDPKSSRLIGSQDGIHWDPASDTCIATDYTPDTHGTIVWDEKTERFVWFTRATNLYHTRGARRKVGRLEHTALWEEWPLRSENVLLPDQVDAETNHNYFYGMPTRIYGDTYIGFLWSYQHQQDITVGLATSRDGMHFQRPADRVRFIDVGEEGSWDGGMVHASGWVEVGDEWWIFYGGTSGRHHEIDPVPGIGLATMRKEGFASLQSPPSGGFVVTKTLICPSGRLWVNAEASSGQVRVKVTDFERKDVPGFEESRPITGDGVRQEISWDGKPIGTLAGREIRLEFEMTGTVDLYGFGFTE